MKAQNRQFDFKGCEEDQLENKRLLESYKLQLDAIMEHSHDSIYISDGLGNPINMNKSFTELVGAPRDELMQLHVSELITKGYIPESVVLAVLKEKKHITKMINYRNGRETIVTGVPVFSHLGEIIAVVCNLRDLTQLKSMERDLKEAKKLTEEYRRHLAGFFEEGKIPFSDLICKSFEMTRIKNKAYKVAEVDANVLITGETGVGKDVIARLIHATSKRAEAGSFIKVDCASIPEQLLEAELFGYERGSFTDARKEGKIGRLELAHNGTLFLDEIADLPLRLQVKLLNALQERKITRIGGLSAREINFRIISATNRDLEKMIQEGTFREDLYFRLNVVPIKIPPLRSRREDISPLVEYFLESFNKRYDLDKTVEAEVIDFLENYDWPGNVRELSNVIEQMIVLSHHNLISTEDLPEKIVNYKSYKQFEYRAARTLQKGLTGQCLKEMLEVFEKSMIEKIINQSETLKEASERLGIDISTLTRKRQKYGIVS